MRGMVVSFLSNGTVQHTLKDGFFNPNTSLGGHRSVSRLSEVLFDDISQKFYIHWLKGPKANQSEPEEVWYDNEYGEKKFLHLKLRVFDTYEEAVQYEIDEVNRLRLLGHTFD